MEEFYCFDPEYVEQIMKDEDGARIDELEAENRELREQAACGHHSYRGDALPCGDCGWTKPTPPKPADEKED